jgi:hypothetical protein
MNTDTIVITPELLALLSEIDEFKAAWRARMESFQSGFSFSDGGVSCNL